MPESMSRTRAPILVTGHLGLVGRALMRALRAAGHPVRGLDLRAAGEAGGDVRDRAAVERALRHCAGVVHLAAVSRVIDGERDPALCRAVNVEGTRTLVEAALACPEPPWIVYASSREVYGQAASLPVTEDAPLSPVNAYGRSKRDAEALVAAAGLPAAIVRFSNVYGCVRDHADRVVPAFARNAALGLPLRVDGTGNTFDFTHVSDTVAGVMAVVGRLQSGAALPPVHFVTGRATTLGELARLAVELAGSASPVREAPPRDFDVHAFRGDPSRAARVLGWSARVGLREGLARLVRDFRAREGDALPA
jgi:nucleoside-diphosphate-sugar epimerase